MSVPLIPGTNAGRAACRPAAAEAVRLTRAWVAIWTEAGPNSPHPPTHPEAAE